MCLCIESITITTVRTKIWVGNLCVYRGSEKAIVNMTGENKKQGIVGESDKERHLSNSDIFML